MKQKVLWRELKGSIEPFHLYHLLHEQPCSFFLDSGQIGVASRCRYSFIGFDPFLVVTSRGKEITVRSRDNLTRLTDNPLQVLDIYYRRYAALFSQGEVPEFLPFTGGMVGFFSYDLGRQIEEIPDTCIDDAGMEDCYLGFYDAAFIYDHQEKVWYAVATGLPYTGEEGEKQARTRLAEMKELFTRACRTAPPVCHVTLHSPGRRRIEVESDFTEAEYLEAVERAREYIAAGDIFQVNLSHRLTAPLPAAPWEIYLTLRTINPAPFSAYLNFAPWQVACASMERFLLLDRGHVQTRPIKGTRPRGRTPEEDERMRQELAASTKDKAELLMIVDLERNDLGRVCRIGSVRVPDLYAIEEYPTVFHLVSTIEGDLAEDKSPLDLLTAAFPGGSITGAPKIRAMEIIDELEKHRRAIYCGSIGYLSFHGRMDLNIVIRTIYMKQGRAYFHVGGGLTIDSDPRFEYEETWHKARALIRALELA